MLLIESKLQIVILLFTSFTTCLNEMLKATHIMILIDLKTYQGVLLRELLRAIRDKVSLLLNSTHTYLSL